MKTETWEMEGTGDCNSIVAFISKGQMTLQMYAVICTQNFTNMYTKINWLIVFLAVKLWHVFISKVSISWLISYALDSSWALDSGPPYFPKL